MPLVVRTWNLFHGNTVPPQRRAFLREMVELVAADEPGVVCLQELPLWALPLLGAWSGMQAVSAVARGPRSAASSSAAGSPTLNHGVLRSAVTGQANAILVAPRFDGRRRADARREPLRRAPGLPRRFGSTAGSPS